MAELIVRNGMEFRNKKAFFRVIRPDDKRSGSKRWRVNKYPSGDPGEKPKLVVMGADKILKWFNKNREVLVPREGKDPSRNGSSPPRPQLKVLQLHSWRRHSVFARLANHA